MPIELSDREVQDLLAFVQALTGPAALGLRAAKRAQRVVGLGLIRPDSTRER